MSIITGTEIEINVPKNYKGKINEIDGITEQASTTGKNKLPNNFTSQTVSGVTFTRRKDGTIIVNGISTAVINLAVDSNIKLEDGQSYKLLGCPTNGSTSKYYLQLNQYYSSASHYSQDIGNGVNFTYNIASQNSNGVNIIIQNGVTINNLIFKPMIILSTETDNTYEQYTGGNPSPSPDYPQDIVSVGSNVNLSGGLNYTYTANGITFTTYEDGSVKANGTATATTVSIANADAVSNNYYVVLPKGTYSISTGTAKIQLQVMNIDTSTLIADTSTTNFATTFTLTETTRVYARAKISNGVTVSNETIYPKLEKGSVATSYSPYNRGSIGFKVSNKNLYDKNNIQTGILISDTGVISSNSAWDLATPYVSATPNTNYILSLIHSTYFQFNIYEYDENRNFIRRQQISNSSASMSFTISNTTKYIRFGNRNNQNMSNIQVEKGSTATSYVAHQEQIVTVPMPEGMELCNIDTYKDKFVKQNGKWYKHKEIGKVILNGTESYNVDNTKGRIVYEGIKTLIKTPSSDAYVIKALCDRLIAKSLRNVYNDGEEGIACSSTGNLSLHIDNVTDTGTATETSVKTWIASNNIIIYYALATSVEEEITDTDTLEALEKLQNIILYEGYNLIETIDYLEPTFELEYLKIAEDYDFYISADGYFISEKDNIKNLINFQESNIPSLAEASETSVKIAGTDGDIPLMTTYQPIPFDIVCYTEDNLSSSEKIQEENKVNTLLNRIKNTNGKFAFEEQEKFYEVKYSGALSTIRYPKHLRFEIPLKSSKPFAKYFVEKNVEGDVTFNSDTVKETGGIFTIKGPATSPKIYFNDYEMYYTSNIASGARLIIDSNNSTATMVSAEGIKTNVMKYYNHQFPKIENGENVLNVYSGVSASQVSLKWYDLKF